jgi:formylglycine-generating enzyme required for sulfatase activity
MKKLAIAVVLLAVCSGTSAQGSPQLKNGQAYNPDGIALVYVEGSGTGIRAKKGFYIGKYEITQDEWEAVMGDNPSEFKGKRNPVEHVSWNNVQVFLKKLNELTGRKYRLPTGAEWVYAANGGSNRDTYKYAGSNDIDEVAWYRDNSSERTHTVGTKKPNSIGIYDMTGNVWEWCQDCYDATESDSACSERVMRGGGWNYRTSDCEVSVDYYRMDPSVRYNYIDIGFRVVLDP